MKRTAKKSIKHTFFKYCDEDKGGCGKKFKPNGKGQRICEKCKAKRRMGRPKK